MSSSDSSFSVQCVSLANLCVQGLSCRTLFLLLCCWRIITASCGSTGTTSRWGSSSATAGADVQEQVLNILALESLSNYQKPCLVFSSLWRAHLGEESCPDGLDLLDLCGLDQRLELVGLALVSCCAHNGTQVFIRTVISTPSSARMRAA
jgi:hypothetical protein